MIQNMNLQSFRPFGTLVSDKAQPPHYANSHAIALTPDCTCVYQAVAPTYLRSDSGMCILSVSQEDGNYQDFYLDKPVQLLAGTWFCLTGFEGAATVRMSAFSLPRPVVTKENTRSFRVQPKLHVQTLYTFFYHEKEPGFLFPGESHSRLELTYVDQGTLHSVADGQDLLLQPGEMVLYGPNQWHMQYADAGVAPRFVSITFDTTACSFAPLLNRKLVSPQKAVPLLKQMLFEQEHPDAFAEDMILSLLNQLLISLLREAGTIGEALKKATTLNNENEIIRKVQQYVVDHVCDRLSVPIVAAGAKVSPSYLTALFQKHLQLSPGEYIRRIKLQKSRQMIREGNLNITQIAEALQYSTIHHFSRQFKEKFGITPSEYAKSIR